MYSAWQYWLLHLYIFLPFNQVCFVLPWLVSRLGVSFVYVPLFVVLYISCFLLWVLYWYALPFSWVGLAAFLLIVRLYSLGWSYIFCIVVVLGCSLQDVSRAEFACYLQGPKVVPWLGWERLPLRPLYEQRCCQPSYSALRFSSGQERTWVHSRDDVPSVLWMGQAAVGQVPR